MIDQGGKNVYGYYTLKSVKSINIYGKKRRQVADHEDVYCPSRSCNVPWLLPCLSQEGKVLSTAIKLHSALILLPVSISPPA